MEELEMEIMNIIINSGERKNHAYMALNNVNEKNMRKQIKKYY